MRRDALHEALLTGPEGATAYLKTGHLRAAAET